MFPRSYGGLSMPDEMSGMLNQLIKTLKGNSVEVYISGDAERDAKRLKKENNTAFVCDALSVAADVGIVFFGGFENKKNSALAEHHIAIIKRDAICKNILDAYNLATSKSSVIFATSTASKTGDIEGKLIWGMHGPKKFTVVLEIPEGGKVSDLESEMDGTEE